MTVAAATPHTDAVIALLTAGDVLVGRGRVPAGAGWQGEPGRSNFVAYTVLYPGAGLTDGDLADPNEYLDWSAQATCVGAVQDQASQQMDRVKGLLVGVRPVVAGRSCYQIYIDLDRPAERDDDTAPPLHYSVAQFRFRSGPA